MTRIPELDSNEMRRDLLPSLLSDLEDVACEGSELARILTFIDSNADKSEIIRAACAIGGVITDYFNSVLNYVASIRNLPED